MGEKKGFASSMEVGEEKIAYCAEWNEQRERLDVEKKLVRRTPQKIKIVDPLSGRDFWRTAHCHSQFDIQYADKVLSASREAALARLVSWVDERLKSTRTRVREIENDRAKILVAVADDAGD